MDSSDPAETLIAPNGRSFATSWAPAMLEQIFQAGFRTRYRGVPMVKCPFDIVIYMQLIGKLRPQTIIEIGSYQGGSALWFVDMIRNYSQEARVISIDTRPPEGVRHGRVTFLEGDACALGVVLTEDLLAQLPRPWLVVEDSAHFYETSRGVLDFFEHRLRPGEYIVIEDGMVAEMTDPLFRQYQNGPNRAVASFLESAGERYEIDANLCDLFGYNLTFHPNGWLRRTGLHSGENARLGE